MTLLAGTRLGPYQIVAPLDAGGMGEVYRARDPRIGREVAIKVLPESFAHDRERLRRFEQEARAAGALNHPALMTIYDIGQQDGAPYIVSELLEGETLRGRLHGGALAPRRAIDYAIQISHGLAAAHTAGIVHRDIKPENIFITKDGRVKILDFGLAKARTATATDATEPGAVMGTAGYMSPEQVRGEAVDQRSDIFSLGVVLHEMLTGTPPFKRDSAVQTMNAILASDPPDIPISSGLQRVVGRCLEKHPEARYQSAADLAFHLENVTEISGTSAAVVAQRSFAPYLIAVVVVVLGVAGYAIWRRNATPASGPAPASRKMIVVLPFENLGSRNDDNLTDGIAHEISSRLASVNGLGVISRTSAVQYKNAHKTARQIGRELGVDYILEGSVRWATAPASRVRLTTDLIRVADDSQLWSRTFDEDLRDIFQVQSDIARNVTDELGVALGGGPTLRPPTNNLEAYQDYLRGLSFIVSVWNTEAVRSGEEFFERAVQLDPQFAQAWARLSRIHSFLYFFYDHTPERLEKARVALEMARRLAPGDTQTLLAEGYYYKEQQQEEPAAAAFEAALRVTKNDPEAVEALAATHAQQGKFDLALVESRRALLLNPRDPELFRTVSAGLNRLGRFSEAAGYVERTIALTPDDNRLYAYKALDLFRGGAKPLDAEKETERAPDQSDLELLETKVRLLVYGGDCRRALPILDTWQIGVQPKFLQAIYLRNEGVWRVTCGQPARGREVLLRSLKVWNEIVRQQPEQAYAHFFRGLTLSYLGQHEEAIVENRRAVELAGSVTVRNTVMQGLAETLSMAGERKAALDLIDELLNAPSSNPLTTNDLRYAPWWKSLRSEPRFQALLRR